MVARLHPRMRLGRARQREDRVDQRLQPPALHRRPHGARQFVGDHRLELGVARPQRRPGKRQPSPHHLEHRDRRLGATLHGDRHMPPVVGKAPHVARHIVAAHHVEHRRHARPAGDRAHALDEILSAIVDRVIRAMRQRGRHLGVRSGGDDDRDAEDVAQADRPRADPAGAAVDEHRVALGREGALEQVGPHGEQRLGQRRRLDHGQRLGHGQALADRRDRLLEREAAAAEIASPIPPTPGGA